MPVTSTLLTVCRLFLYIPWKIIALSIQASTWQWWYICTLYCIVTKSILGAPSFLRDCFDINILFNSLSLSLFLLKQEINAWTHSCERIYAHVCAAPHNFRELTRTKAHSVSTGKSVDERNPFYGEISRLEPSTVQCRSYRDRLLKCGN